MVYKESLVCVVKHAGNILREKDSMVSLPFNSEYSLLFKNLNSRRVSISISIDGVDVLDNRSLIIEGNSESELEGFLNGNVARNKFKFIQKTKEIQDYRGDRIDDGMIRIEFAFEKRVSEEVVHRRTYIHEPYYYPPYPYNTSVSFNNGQQWTNSCQPLSSTHCVNSGDSPGEVRAFNCSMVGAISEPIPNEGITVKGSEVNQNFNYTSIGELDSSQVIILRLCGEKVSGAKIKKPVTVKTKLRCSSCGKKSKSSSQFCSACGTLLE